MCFLLCVQYQFTAASGSAYDQLYTSPPLVAAFTNYWQTLAQAFRSQPAVVGYELMNEPWAGDVLKQPELIVPGVADRLKLAPFFEAVSKG